MKNTTGAKNGYQFTLNRYIDLSTFVFTLKKVYNRF